MAQFIRTFSESFLQRHRDTHAKHPTFGTHRHPYLHDLMLELAMAIPSGPDRPRSMLDYGCGKGVFMVEIARLKLFHHIHGYDPAVAMFKARPSHLYDVVTCLDVLDQLENSFVESVIADVAQFTGHFAVFDVITRQSPKFEHLNPRSAETWYEIINRHMLVSKMTIRPSTQEEIDQGACPERVIITAEPRDAATGDARTSGAKIVL